MRTKRLVASVFAILVGVTLMVTPAQAEPWLPKKPPLSTPWTEQVRPDNALPDYPRPQFARPRWQNLNGLWNYLGQTAEASAEVPTARPPTDQYREQILVPYPPESALSGIQRHDDVMWYSRTFEVPADWRTDQRIRLHFGAVDQIATVWVNGKEVASHEGGYTEFSADITAALRETGPQELTVRAQDLGEASTYPVGKQRNQPGGILYVGSSGIWQSVWLEPVPTNHLSKLDFTTDLTGISVVPSIVASGESEHSVELAVSAPGGGEVAKVIGKPGQPIRIDVPQPRLWTPDDPYLYDITARLLDLQGQLIDQVHSYVGLRTIGVVRDAHGKPRIALNGEVTFLHGPLDQGYWPDGGYTAPTDEALRFDLAAAKELGFNFVRKHVKVEPARWYYWADKLGLMVWQDMPSLPISLKQPPGPLPDPPQVAKKHFETELTAMIEQLRNVTSIVGWVPFNEGWGEFDTVRVAESVKRQDPSRLVNAASGVNCCFSRPDTGAGDIYDDHTYVGPGRPKIRDDRPTVAGEYGGLGVVLQGHSWPGQPNAYEMTENQERLTQRYVEVSEQLATVVRQDGLSGAIYTQLSDVENEVNGLYTYDRRIAKLDKSAAAKHNRAVIIAGS